jgi:hypothetical protein
MDKTDCDIQYKNETIIHGQRDPSTQGLWLATIPEHTATMAAPACAVPAISAPDTTSADLVALGLWLAKQTPAIAAPAISSPGTNLTDASPANLVAFAHASLWSPSYSTMWRAMMKEYLPPFHGLSLATLKKYPPHSEATTMGHLDNKRKNIRSTKHSHAAINLDPDDDTPFPTQPVDNT